MVARAPATANGSSRAPAAHTGSPQDFPSSSGRRWDSSTVSTLGDDLDCEASCGRLVHTSPDGARRSYVRQDGETGVLTTTGPDGGELRNEYLGVDLEALT